MKDCGTILIVDSDDASRLTAAEVAVRLGYDARPTPTADELVERLGSDRPTLAIVEVELPGAANGLEVMRQLHESFDGDLPVILVSASQTDAFDRMAGLMLGADDYVSKPLDPGELLARQALARRAVPKANVTGTAMRGTRTAPASAHASARSSASSPRGGRKVRSPLTWSSARRPSRPTSSTSSPSSASTPARKQSPSHSGAASSSLDVRAHSVALLTLPE